MGWVLVGKNLYLQALESPTIAIVDEVKEKMDPKTREYLDKTPDEEQYMAYAGKLHGNKTSNIVESMNNANKPARAAAMFPAFVQIAKDSQRRFHKNRKLAHARHSVYPSKVDLSLKVQQAKAERYGIRVSFNVFFQGLTFEGFRVRFKGFR